MDNDMLQGEYRADGTWIGYDYDRQEWIDTSPDAERDGAYPIGSACNPRVTLFPY